MSELTFKDYATDQEVRWCPGCGDYSILKAVHRALADAHADPATTVFVSGIGCSSRLPYYVETYGFHTIHGRAPAIATGVKLANPALDVWVITGDGDGLSIGGNHLLHALRRNIDLNILLFNNEIYGLTKGQYSPTSRVGTVSPSSPGGSIDTPVNPGLFAVGAGATFIARAVDIDQKGLPPILNAARDHRGARIATAACASSPEPSPSRRSPSARAASPRPTCWCTTRPAPCSPICCSPWPRPCRWPWASSTDARRPPSTPASPHANPATGAPTSRPCCTAATSSTGADLPRSGRRRGVAWRTVPPTRRPIAGESAGLQHAHT
jgi:hypothetical protein